MNYILIIINKTELVFTENRGGHGIYYYTMKIENHICTWSCDRSEVQRKKRKKRGKRVQLWLFTQKINFVNKFTLK